MIFRVTPNGGNYSAAGWVMVLLSSRSSYLVSLSTDSVTNAEIMMVDQLMPMDPFKASFSGGPNATSHFRLQNTFEISLEINLDLVVDPLFPTDLSKGY